MQVRILHKYKKYFDVSDVTIFLPRRSAAKKNYSC